MRARDLVSNPVYVVYSIYEYGNPIELYKFYAFRLFVASVDSYSNAYYAPAPCGDPSLKKTTYYGCFLH